MSLRTKSATTSVAPSSRRTTWHTTSHITETQAKPNPPYRIFGRGTICLRTTSQGTARIFNLSFILILHNLPCYHLYTLTYIELNLTRSFKTITQNLPTTTALPQSISPSQSDWQIQLLAAYCFGGAPPNSVLPLMHQDDMVDYVDHSNDSLLASADEMAGDYSPHTNSNGFMPVTPNPGTSTESTPHRSDRYYSPDLEDLEDNYPMPDEPEVWRQAEHPDTINKLLNVTGDACMERFKGAAKMLSHANPDTFLMPLEARVICMKLDTESDMVYCLSTGTITNLPSCNKRIDEVWAERDGQRVFMMFSISGKKEFCAMAEVLGPVLPGSMPGWTKPGCSGVTLLTFIFVKNVPFILINHIKNRAKQPVANMWNSMLYRDNRGYHVAKIYVEHPVLASILIKVHTEVQVNYKSQLRIASTGNTQYSASSLNSHNSKSYDPRSATKVSLHRSGNRTQTNNNDRHAIHDRPWRNNIPPTPSRPSGHFINAGQDTSTPVAHHHRGMLHTDTTGATASPPPQFPLSGNVHTTSRSVVHAARSFTTEDDRMLANFASSRDAKRSDANHKPQNFHPASTSADPFRDVRTFRPGQQFTPAPINTDWRNAGEGAHVGRHQNTSYDVQWQNNGRAAQVPVFLDNSSVGLGIDPGTNRPYHYNGQQSSRNMEGEAPHLPSPAASSQHSRKSSPQHSELRRQQSQGFPMSTPQGQHVNNFPKHHGHPVPQSATRATQAPLVSAAQHHITKAGSPIKHSQSMPAMIAQIRHRLSAQHLLAHDSLVKPEVVNPADPQSPGVQDWVVTTPTRPAAASTEHRPDSALTVRTSTEFSESPEKPMNSAKLAADLKFIQGQVAMLEVEIEIARANGLNADDKQRSLKWHSGKAACLEVELAASYKADAAAHEEHNQARGDLAQSTVNHPADSQGTPHNSAQWASWPASVIESDLITPEVDENGKILRSASKRREGKAVFLGQKLRHRRGDVGGGFTSSFDARASANVDKLISSPTLENVYTHTSPARTHGHPPQRTLEHHTHGQHDSCTEDQHCSEDSDYAGDVASQVGQDNDDELFSPRGRSYQHSQQARDVSQMSYAGGIKLK